MLLDKDISIDTFIKYTIQLLDFSKLEKKIKESEISGESSEYGESSSSEDDQ
jgi:hypothetical protein